MEIEISHLQLVGNPGEWKGELHIHSIRCENLPAVNKFSSGSDPFCTFGIMDAQGAVITTQKTSVQKKTLSCEWKNLGKIAIDHNADQFFLEVWVTSTNTQRLTLQDWNRLASNTIIKKSTYDVKWLKLSPPDVTKELTFSVSLSGNITVQYSLDCPELFVKHTQRLVF